MSRAPFKLLDFYHFEDADLFFGREEETRRMTGEILSTRLLALFSPSGSGKTSLINAGVRPLLEKMGYRTIYTRLEDAPISSICRAVAKALQLNAPQDEQPDLHGFLKQATTKIDKPLVIFLDQFEEFFLAFRSRPEIRRDFIGQIARVKYDDDIPVFLVLALREDYFANLHEFREAIPSIFQNNANTRLQPFSDEQARRAVEGPIKAVGWSIEHGLVDALISDLKKEGEGIEPITLQLVCGTLWAKAQSSEKSNQITLALYRACGGADKILQNFIYERLKTIPSRQQPIMARILDALKTPENTKRLLTFGDLKKELKIKSEQRLETVLEKLTGLDILRSEEQAGTRWYEFKHDYLAPRIAAWLQQRRERKMRRRLRFALFILPGIILFLLVCSYFFIQYNTFYAGFDSVNDYDYHKKEIVIDRGFNPFKERIRTGFLSESDLDATAGKVIDKSFRLSFWDKDDWTALAEIMKSLNGGKILYLCGQKKKGIENILQEIRDYGERDADWETAAALAEVYPDFIDELLRILGDKTSNFRSEAATALRQIGKGNDRAIAGLMNVLKDENEHVRRAAAEALGKTGKGNEKEMAALLNALKDEDFYVRSAAAAALGKTGQGDEHVITGLINALKDEDSNVCIEAARYLLQLDQGNKQAIAGLLKALQDKDRYVRIAASYALGQAGKGNDRAIAGLLNALKDKESHVRQAAAESLGKVGACNEQAIAGLLKTLQDKYSGVRRVAAWALGDAGQGNKQVIASLINALRNKNSDVRRLAAWALGKTGAGHEQAIAGLLNALKDGDSSVRSSAAEALGEIGQGNEQMIAGLLNALKNKDYNVREAAAEALGLAGQGNEQAIAGLIKALQDKECLVRSKAFEALGKAGVGNEQAIAALLKTLNNKESNYRSEAAAALGKIGAGNEKAISGIIDTLKDKDSYVRKAAAWALAQLGVDNKSAITIIKNALKDEDKFVREAAAEALGQLLGKKPDQELLTMLRYHDSGDRIAAAHALAQKTKLDKSTLEKIKRIVKDEKEPIWARLAALDCIELILAKEKEEE